MRSKSPPTAKDLIAYIAEYETLAATQKHFQLDRNEVTAVLLGRPGRQPELALSTPSKRSAAMERLGIFCDGASRGNPGPAGAGAVIVDPEGTIIARLGRFLGETTNNVAEYEGLLLGVARAQEMGAREVDIAADSELLVKQIKGEYRVKNAALKKLHAKARSLLEQFDRWSIRHVYREQNAEADEMSNRAIDERM